MIIIFKLDAVSEMLNSNVQEILTTYKVDIPRLASASLGFMMHYINNPCMQVNLDTLNNPLLYDVAPDLDAYLYELQLKTLRAPYTTENLKIIISDFCKLVYLDVFNRLQSILTAQSMLLSIYDTTPVKWMANVVYCDFKRMDIECQVI